MLIEITEDLMIEESTIWRLAHHEGNTFIYYEKGLDHIYYQIDDSKRIVYDRIKESNKKQITC